MLVSPGRLGRIGSTALHLVPPAAAVWAVNTIVMEGDSISSTTPNQVSNQSDFYSYYWKGQNPGKTVSVPAQASRTVGGAAVGADLADNGSPAGNTLFAHIADDNASAPDLVTVMIGANDLGSFAASTYTARLITWATSIRSATRKIAYSPPTPYRATSPHPNYATYTARRATLLATVRDPAVWGQWADYYIPMGEHPDFLYSANDAALYGDGVHPSGPVTLASTGQARLYAIYDAAMQTLIDQTRASSTTVLNSVWPADETGLAANAQIVRRFIIKGIAHTGLALGASIAGGGAEIRLNGGAWGASVGTGGANGYRIYNGDVIDIRLTTSASGNTATNVDLTIGSESRAISFTTSAVVTPIARSNAGTASSGPTSTAINLPGLTFGTGVAVVSITCFSTAGGTVDSVPPTLTLTPTGGGPAIVLTKRLSGGRAASRAFAVYTGSVDAGTYNLTGTRPNAARSTWASFVTLENANPVPVAAPAVTSVTSEADPHLATAVTVPAFGIALGWLMKENTAAGGAGSGSTLINSGNITDTGSTAGLVAVERATTGQCSMTTGFGTWGRGALAFAALGT